MRVAVFIKNEKFLKTLYKVLRVVIIAVWVALFVCLVMDFSVKKYFYPLRYKEEVFYYSDLYGLDRAFVFAVIKTESGFDQNAKSEKGALGLMQILPVTADYIATQKGIAEYDLSDAKTNIDFGCFYLRYLIDRFNELFTAAAAYNAGETRVALWLKDARYSIDGKTLYYIPIYETREYVKKINESFLKYNKLYEKLLDKRTKFG